MASGQNGSVAPVCPISRSQAVPGQPGIMLPSIPKAMDLPSVIMAVNAITQILINMTVPPRAGGVSPIQLGTPALAKPTGGVAASGVSGKASRGTWFETDRQTEVVKVVNPDDDTQFVTFERINSITMTNSSTNESLTWTR